LVHAFINFRNKECIINIIIFIFIDIIIVVVIFILITFVVFVVCVVVIVVVVIVEDPLLHVGDFFHITRFLLRIGTR